MKKHFAVCRVNKATGNIDHIAVSDLPLNEEMCGCPDDHAASHVIKRFEFDADPGDAPIIRGRDVLAMIEMSGNTPAEKANDSAEVMLSPGKTGMENMTKGSQPDGLYKRPGSLPAPAKK